MYFFRLDKNRVIDATMSGGLVRYINHSCNPNCFAKIIKFNRKSHIIIFAQRRISRGEEVKCYEIICKDKSMNNKRKIN